MAKKNVKPPKKVIPDKSLISWHSYVADKGGCGHIRVIWPSLLANVEKFGSYNIQLNISYGMRFIMDKEFYKDKLFIVLQRAATEQQLEIVKYLKNNVLKESNTKIIYEIDDDLIDIPEWNFASSYYEKNRQNCIEIMKNSYGVVTSTGFLAQKFRKYNNNIVTNSNHLPKFMWGEVPEIKEKNEKPRILWCGSANHFALPNSDKEGGDFGNELLNFIKKTTDIYDWVFIGALPKELMEIKDSITFYNWRGMYEYPIFMKSLNVDMGISPLLKHDFNRSKCLVEGARLITDNGIKKISDIKVGNNVWQEHGFKKVSNLFKYKNKPTLELVTEMGYTIEGTYNHKIRCNNKFVELKNLKVGDFIDLGTFDIKRKEYQTVIAPLLLTKKLDEIDTSFLNQNNAPKIKLNEDWGRFIGYILGDGNIGINNQVNITVHKDNQKEINDIINFIKGIGLTFFTNVKKHCNKEGNAITITIPSRNLKWIFVNKFELKGKYYKNFKIPELIFNSPKSVIKEFLKGLFETDGTVCDTNNRVSFSTRSIDLARDVQFILLGFDIVSKIQKRYNSSYKKYYYNVVLGRQATDIFYESIGFISDFKNNRLKKIYNKSHSNRYKEWDFKDKIIEINYKNNDVFDIEVPDGNYYNANGIISHNSNIKAIEYTASGIPGIYTNITPYENLTLTCDTDEQMIYNIELLAANDDKRTEVFQKDHEILKSQLFWEENDNLKKYVNNFLSFFNMRLPE